MYQRERKNRLVNAYQQDDDDLHKLQSEEQDRSEEHTSELQSPVPISYAVFCLKKKKTKKQADSKNKKKNR